jgi:hypothetical protein
LLQGCRAPALLLRVQICCIKQQLELALLHEPSVMGLMPWAGLLLFGVSAADRK